MNYFGKDSKTTTLTTGYSQGGAAARTYVEDYGNKQGLDYAVMLAPMGGNNGRGEDGIWGGTKNGVQTLGIENKYDPARGLWDRKGDEGGDVGINRQAQCDGFRRAIDVEQVLERGSIGAKRVQARFFFFRGASAFGRGEVGCLHPK